MTEHLTFGDNTLACDQTRDGPPVLLSHGSRDRRRSYRFPARVVPRA